MSQGRGFADIGIVVGGDGRFSYYGRTEDMPLLFVGVKSKEAAGSKAYLAEVSFDELPDALETIRSGGYRTEEHKRLAVLKEGRTIGEVFTDVYLQRGNEGNALRYRVKVLGPTVRFEEAAISDGVVVTTKAGSTGYYSYVDRIHGDFMDPNAFANVGADEVGICHIDPTYTERYITGGHPLRYRVPWGGRIELSLFREADARLYGVSGGRTGVRVALGETVAIIPGKKVTRTVSLR